MTLAMTAGELYLDYGRGFWDIQRDRLMEIEAWQRELDKCCRCHIKPNDDAEQNCSQAQLCICSLLEGIHTDGLAGYG